MEDQHSLPTLSLSVATDSLPQFTTLLQSGIEVKAQYGDTLAHFLNDLPGITAEYLAETVQTIFLNGTAVDDLSTQLTGHRSTLALSAAMPGLAGAIFRRNSFHSALRTETEILQSEIAVEETITVTLKLFNSIARERGEELLQRGIIILSNFFATFLAKRPHLLQEIVTIKSNSEPIESLNLPEFLANSAKLKLIIVGTDG